MCDLVMCLLSVMLCACSSHLGPNSAPWSIVKEDVGGGMEGEGWEMLSSLITSTFFSLLSVGSELHCCSAPVSSFWPLLMSQLLASLNVSAL